MAEHLAPRPRSPLARWRRWSRRRKVTVSALMAVVLGMGGTALALALYKAPIGGSSQAIAPVVLKWDSVGAITPDNPDTTTCTGSVASGKLTITIVGTPGAFCTYVGTLSVANAAGKTYVVQDLKFNPSVTVGYMGTGCGQTVTSAGNGSVTFKVTIPSNATVNASPIPADATAGAYAVEQSQYVAANCPVAS